MIPGNSRKAEDVLSQILDLTEPERLTALHNLCSDDPAVAAEVERLLASIPAADSFFAQFDVDIDDQHSQLVGRRVGTYRIRRELGHGGMGAVYLADRDDGQFRRDVAIKFVSALAAGGDAWRRFESEKSILASLRHPNIAQLLDAGVMEDATPYIVMELVEGEPIDRYCRERELSIPVRIRLFQQICAAVDFTHRNLIVHRDIKPGNILVTPEGVPKLLDFGISRVLSAAGETGDATAPERRLMTLNYSSPEQVRGQAVSTSSDIYSLGLVLYELLAGHPAYSLSGASAEEILRRVLDDDPPPPRAGPDLDQIVAMAIRKTPEERYASVAALSADLDTYLSGRPVAARSGGWQYRARKFLSRNKWSVATSAAAVVLAGAGVWEIVSQSRLAARRFEQIRSFSNSVLVDMPGRLPALTGNSEFRRTLIAEGLRYLDSASREAQGDPTLLLELAQGYMNLGRLQLGDGVSLKEDPAALGSLRRAQVLFEQIPFRSAEGPTARRDYIRLLSDIGNAQGGAERETARRLSREWYETDPRSRDAAIAYATSLMCETCPASSSQQIDQLRQAAVVLDTIESSAPGDEETVTLAADAHYRLAYSALWRLDRDDINVHAHRAKELYDRLLAAKPNDASRITTAALADLLVGDSELWNQNLPAARAVLERSIQLLVNTHGTDQQDFTFRSQAAVSYMVLSEVDMEENHPKDAERTVDLGLAQLQKYPASMLENYSVQLVLAGLYTHRAEARARQKTRTAACADFLRGSELYQNTIRLQPGVESVPYLRRLIDSARNGATACQPRE